jgi:hypothetical protein
MDGWCMHDYLQKKREGGACVVVDGKWQADRARVAATCVCGERRVLRREMRDAARLDGFLRSGRQ